MTDSSDTQLHSLKNFGFQKKILSANNADFFFISQAYLNAYLQLLDGINRPGSLFVLIGEAGVGKTYLLRKLANEALETIRIVFCYSTILDYDNLIVLINDQLGIANHDGRHLNQFTALKDYLNNCPMQGISVALLIDDAHYLGEEGLDHLVRLSTQELTESHGLRILLSGTPVLEELLRKVLRKHGLEMSITPVHLKPLVSTDVATYISRKLKNTHDLNVNALFLSSVTETISSYTGGIPRLINSLCEHTLFNMQLNEEENVSIASIKEAAKELMLEERISHANTLSYSEKTSLDDTTQIVKAVHESMPNTNCFSEENRKKIIKSLLADLEEEPKTELDNAVSEAVLPDSSADHDTLVSFEAAKLGHGNSLVQTTGWANHNENALNDPSEHRKTEVSLTNESVTALSKAIRQNDFQSGQKSSEAVRSPQLQMTAFLLLALLAGVLGGAGSLYFFRLMPEWILESLPAQRETSAPAPTPVPSVTPATMSTSDPREGLSVAPVSVVEPTASGVPTPAPPSGRLGPPTEPASVSRVNLPDTSLESSPVTTPRVEVAPSVAEIEIASVFPPHSERTTVETPRVSSYMDSGDALLARGDVASARLFYEAAAAFGYAMAMTAVGKTYDPVTLNHLGVKGFRADPIKAAEWYLKAQKAGDPETIERIEELKRWVADGPAWKETELNTLRQLLR